MIKLITKQDIEQIIKKYNIGKRPLSIILGFGEITITRYLEDYPITKQKSDILYNVLNNPEIFLEYLEKNKNEISNIAYAKSKRQVEELLNTSFDNDNEIENISSYIIKHNGETTNLSLQKILYYCQLFSYVIYNKPMFSSKCSAWEHGPVFSNIYYQYKACGSEILNSNKEYDISINNKEIVDEIIKVFGCYSGKVLCYFTHCEDTWKTKYNNIDDTISNNDLQLFARKIKQEYNINNIYDISKYSIALMTKYMNSQEVNK